MTTQTMQPDWHKCTYCPEDYWGFPGSACEDCQDDMLPLDEPCYGYGEECEECGMDMGEHFRACRWHRDNLS